MATTGLLRRLNAMAVATTVVIVGSYAVTLWHTSLAGQSASAQIASQEQRPYDDKLIRLAEILGAVHFLRELCGNNDGMMWRDRMVELMDAEASSALRRVRLTRAFNTGYRSYSRTYTTCTSTAQTSIVKFMTEGAEISDALVKIQ